MNKETQVTEKDKEMIESAFERYDRLLDFEKRLTTMINSMGIDSLLSVPDYILSATARQQMELTSEIIKCTKRHE